MLTHDHRLPPSIVVPLYYFGVLHFRLALEHTARPNATETRWNGLLLTLALELTATCWGNGERMIQTKEDRQQNLLCYLGGLRGLITRLLFLPISII